MATPRKKMCKVRLPSASGQQASIFQFTSPIGQQSPARSTVDITVVTPASNRDATSSSAEENNREENQSKAPQRASRSIERTPKPRTTLQRAHQPSPNTVHHSTSNITPSHQPSEASNKENDREENQSKAPQRASRSIERTPKPRTTLQRAHQPSPNTVHHSTSNITPSHQPSEASNKENDREENQSKAPQRASRSIERTPKPRTTLQRAHQPSPNTVHHSTSNITPSHQPSEASNKENDSPLDSTKLPRQRKVPKRIAGNGEQYTAPDRVTYYRKIYFQFFDSIDVNLENRFDIEKTGLSTYRKLENMLISGQVDEVTNRYPELNIDSLRIQLQMFIGSTGAKSVTEAKSAFVAMVPEVRALFPQVFQLLILLLVCPVSSCEAERSFSALRRLKTWLRSTMTQERLNYVCVNNVHRERLDRISLSKQVDIFISKSEIRRSMFGNPRNVGQ